MAKRTPPFPEYEEWSEARFWSFVRSALRAAWSRWPPKYKLLNAAKRPYVGPNKKQKHEFKCASCGEYFPAKQVSVDHIEPAGSLRCYEDLPDFVRRLFVGEDKLQVLCEREHKLKTAEERRKNKE